MTFVHFALSVVLFVGFALADLQCGIGEALDDCPVDCPTDYCPKSQRLQSCPRPSPCLPPACKCRFNYRRAENGTCIPTTHCPPFTCSGSNERYVPCPSYCPTDDCSQATPDGHCPYFGLILTVVQCSPTCRCIENYWRKDGVCVPYEQCPGK